MSRVLTDEQMRAAVARAGRWAKNNPERLKEIKRDYYRRHREKILAAAKAKTAAKPKAEKVPPKGRDPEKARLSRRRWQERNRDKKNARQRQLRAEKRAAFLAKEAEYRRANRERLNATSRRWAANHPEAKNAYTRARRTKRAGASGVHTAADIARIRDAQRDRCACCRTRLHSGGHVDHIIALSKGGSNWPSNLQLLCGPCNVSKNDRDPVDFMRSRGRLL